MAVMLPSICGVSVADCRDLTVAVYSSLRGTGELLIVTVCTGVGGGAPAATVAGLLQPLTISDAPRIAPAAKRACILDDPLSSPRLLPGDQSPCKNPLIVKPRNL